jgi:hypothetical protein
VHWSVTNPIDNNFKGIQNDANYLEYTPGMESGLAEICGVEKSKQ